MNENNELKRKFIKATIQLVIGIILLGVVWVYSSQIPDRQRTFFNQFNVLFAQAKILFYKILGKGDIAQAQFNDTMALKSLIDIGKQSGCITGDTLQKLENLLKTIEDMSIDEYAQKRTLIISDYVSIQDYLKSKCPGIQFYTP
jgi:hypothetical protein